MSSKPPQTKPLGSIGSIHDSGVSSITKPQIPILLTFNSGRLLMTSADGPAKPAGGHHAVPVFGRNKLLFDVLDIQ